MGRQDQRVSSLVHEIPEARLVSLDHPIFKIYLPWGQIGFTRRETWLECSPICLHEHLRTLSLRKLILDPDHITHVGRAINVLVGDGWILITPGFFVNLVHCLIHLRNLVQRALHRGLTVVEYTTSQLKRVAYPRSWLLKELFVVKKSHSKDALSFFILAKLEKASKGALDWLSWIYNRINVR